MHEPILFHEDNQSYISMNTNYMTNKRSKHIDVCHHVIRYWCKEDVLDFAYTDTHGQLADIMIKCLALPAFTRLRSACMTNIKLWIQIFIIYYSYSTIYNNYIPIVHTDSMKTVFKTKTF